MPRLQIVTGPPPGGGRDSWHEGTTRTSPSDGGFVHYITPPDLQTFPASGGPYLPGVPYRVDAAESFSDGAQLATDGTGRVRTASTGDVHLATALEASSGLDDVVWIISEPQRTL